MPTPNIAITVGETWTRPTEVTRENETWPSEAQATPTYHWPPGPAEGDKAKVFELFGADPLNAQVEWWKSYGDAFTLPLPTGPMVFLAHPDLAQGLFLRHRDHGDMTRNTEPAQGMGITLQHGDEWRRTRRLMTDLFTANRLGEFIAPVVEAVKTNMAELDGYADRGEPLDLAQYMGQITLRVLFRTMFSDEFSADDINRASGHLDVISLYKGGLMSKDWAPPGTPIRHEAEGKAAVEALDEMIYALIDRRRAAGNPVDDLLGRLIAAKDEDGGGFTNDEIRNNLTALIFGGYETTQWAISWTLAFLADNPGPLAKAQALADQVGDPQTLADLERLEYYKALMSEAQRLQGMLMVPRQLENDDTFGEYVIPKGTMVVASPWIIQRRPDFWENPQTYDPDRFLGERKKAQHRFQHIPFGGGGRMCLGMNLAYLEGQIITEMFLRRFDYTVDPAWERKHLQQYSVVLDKGLPVTLRKRVEA